MNRPDQAKFKRYLTSTDRNTKIEGIKEMATGGFGPAALKLGDWLMSGYWDTKEMEFTLAKNQPLLESTDKGDPYLIFGRDPIEALKWYGVAAQSNDANASWEAKYKLAYCRKEGLAGLAKDDAAEKEIEFISNKNKSLMVEAHKIERFIDSNAKSANKDSNDAEKAPMFAPLPNVRPKVLNPRTEIFKHLGRVIRDRCIGHAILLQILAAALAMYWSMGSKTWTEFAIINAIGNAIVAVPYTIPLILFAIWANEVGVRQKRPICSCEKIRKAYDIGLRRLPIECQMGPSPFDNTFILSRNIHLLKRLFFWTQLILALGFIVLFLSATSSIDSLCKSLGIEPIVLLLIAFEVVPLSTLIVGWDIKIPELSGGCERLQLPLAILYSLVAPFLSDKDCSKEIDRADPSAAWDRFLANEKAKDSEMENGVW